MKKQLSKEDRLVWHKITRTITPLGQNQKPAVQTHIHIPPAPKPRIHFARQDLQINKDKKTRRGRVDIDMVIDLHELTRDQAFLRLKSKIKTAVKRKYRCVLIITGKGKNLGGILRSSLGAWLNDENLRPFIASYSPAHIRHGGAGAFYVFLKRL